MAQAEEKLITVIVPQGKGMALLHALYEKKSLRAALGTARAPFTYQKRRGGLTRTVRHSVEKDILTVVVPADQAEALVIAHEMGHAFGLPHSSGAYGEPYDNEWDVMSDTWSNCSRATDPTYGCLGQHTIGFHKDILDWVPGTKIRVIQPGNAATLVLERIALPQTGYPQVIRIPIGGSSSHFYTVETRLRAGYDNKLPGEGVIIHEVNTSWLNPAHVVDLDQNGDTGDAGAIWMPGETFTDSANNISVRLDSTSASGYVVSVSWRGARWRRASRAGPWMPRATRSACRYAWGRAAR